MMRNNTCLTNTVFAVMIAWGFLLAGNTAWGDVSLTNGNFNAGFDADDSDIEDPWYDVTTDTTWQGAWHTDANSPFDSSPMVGLSGYSAPCWLYQSIGTRGTAKGFSFTIDVGAFTGDDASSTGGDLTFGLYKSSTFTPANDLDVDGAAGVTLVDSVSTNTGSMGTAHSKPDTIVVSGSLDLTTVNTTDSLYLRLYWVKSGGDGYACIDNLVLTLIQPSGTLICIQ